MTCISNPLLLDDEASTQLRPAFDEFGRTYTVALWRNGEVVAVHGADGEAFETAGSATEGINAFLAGYKVRPLTEWEECELYGELIRTKGGSGYELLIQQAARRA